MAVIVTFTVTEIVTVSISVVVALSFPLPFYLYPHICLCVHLTIQFRVFNAEFSPFQEIFGRSRVDHRVHALPQGPIEHSGSLSLLSLSFYHLYL
jgi:hypothetical protein